MISTRNFNKASTAQMNAFAEQNGYVIPSDVNTIAKRRVHMKATFPIIKKEKKPYQSKAKKTVNTIENFTASKWQPLVNLPRTSNSDTALPWLLDIFGANNTEQCGVYQLASIKDIDSIAHNDLINALIGYTGKSTADIIKRLSSITTPSGVYQHGVNAWCQHDEQAAEVIDNNADNIMVRIITAKSSDWTNALESKIHDLTEEQYGQRFFWKGASMGDDGLINRMKATISSMSTSNLKVIKEFAIATNTKLAKDAYNKTINSF